MPFKPTKEQIKEWKAKYGTVYQLTAEDGSNCIIRKPDRKVLSHATAVAGSDPIKFNEVVLNDCWIDGDEEMKTDDAKFLAISGKLGEIIELAEVELKEL